MAQLTPPLSAEDHVDGPDRAELELVMYGDFQCPYCTAAYPIVRRIRDQLAGRLLFAFRHFPLREIHPDAERAAEAAEAAAAQGAFWQMHDRMYESRGALGREDLIHYASELGLDAERFTAELDSAVHAPSRSARRRQRSGQRRHRDARVLRRRAAATPAHSTPPR